MHTLLLLAAATLGIKASYAAQSPEAFPTLLPSSDDGIDYYVKRGVGSGTISGSGTVSGSGIGTGTTTSATSLSSTGSSTGTGSGIGGIAPHHKPSSSSSSSSSSSQQPPYPEHNTTQTSGTESASGNTLATGSIPGTHSNSATGAKPHHSSGTGQSRQTASTGLPSGKPSNSHSSSGPYTFKNHTHTSPLSPGVPATGSNPTAPLTTGTGTGIAFYSLGPSLTASRQGSDIIFGTVTISPGGSELVTDGETISAGPSGTPVIFESSSTSTAIPVGFGSCYGSDCIPGSGKCTGLFCHTCFGLDCHSGSCFGLSCLSCIGLGCLDGKCTGPLCFPGGETSCFGVDCNGSGDCIGPTCHSCSGPDCGSDGSCTGPKCTECSGANCQHGICKGTGCTQEDCSGLSKRDGSCSSVSSSTESCSTTEADHCTVPCSYSYTYTGSSLTSASTCLSSKCRTITGCSVRPYTTTTFIGSFSTSGMECPIRFTPYNYAATASLLGIALPADYYGDFAGDGSPAGPSSVYSSVYGTGTGTGIPPNSANATASSTRAPGTFTGYSSLVPSGSGGTAASVTSVPAITSLPAMTSCSLVSSSGTTSCDCASGAFQAAPTAVTTSGSWYLVCPASGSPTTLATLSTSPSGAATAVSITSAASTSSSTTPAVPATTSQVMLYYDRTPSLSTKHTSDYWVIYAYDATTSDLDICAATPNYNGSTSDWSNLDLDPTGTSPTIPTPGLGQTYNLATNPPGQKSCQFEVDNFETTQLSMRLHCLEGLTQDIYCDGYPPEGYNDLVEAPCAGSTNYLFPAANCTFGCNGGDCFCVAGWGPSCASVEYAPTSSLSISLGTAR